MVPTPSYKNYTGIVEGKESGRFTFAYKYKITRVWKGTYNDCLTNAFFRGSAVSFVVDGQNLPWVVAESRVIKDGPVSRLEVDFESLVGQVPPDEFDLQPEDLAPRIERNPSFAQLQTSDFAIVQQALAALTTGAQLVGANKIQGTTNNQLAQKLFDKMRQGQETYYYPAFRYTWSSYSFLASYESYLVSRGGYQTNGPKLAGPLAVTLAANPFSWLRQADAISIGSLSPFAPSSGVFLAKTTRTWIGAENGFWDSDIYPNID